MKKLFFLLAILVATLLIVAASAENTDASGLICEEEGCGGGSYKDDNWPDRKTEVNMAWADTPGFDCLYGVETVTFQIKAGNSYHDPGYCYGATWDQDGWRVWEKHHSYYCKDISHVIVTWTCKCPETCQETVAIYSPWSEWERDPDDLSREFRTRDVTYVDAYNNEIVCGSDVETEYRDIDYCEETTAIYGPWSEWQRDPDDLSREFRTRDVTYVDATYPDYQCGSDVETEYRDIDYCAEVLVIYGEWSAWERDPDDLSREFRTRDLTYVDATYPDHLCGTDVEIEYRDIDYCQQTITVYGEWSDWEINQQNPTQECRVRDLTYVDAVYPDHVCDEDLERQCRPISEEFSITTASACVDATTMGYETTVYAPPGVDAVGLLAVLWHYPNGTPFVTGETDLGLVPIVAGDNVFTSTMTQAELLAAIGDNNMTGGNPANDYMYDHLDLYTYEVILYFGEKEARLVSNLDNLWENCAKGSCCVCPSCGDPQKETGNNVVIWSYPDVLCTSDNCVEWYEGHNPFVKIWSTELDEFVVTHKGDTLHFISHATANGESCTLGFFRDGHDVGDFALWGPDGVGDRMRDHLSSPIKFFSSCSDYPSWCDTFLIDGVAYARWLPSHNTSDWISFLLENDFFPNLGGLLRYEAAKEWAEALRLNGMYALMVWDGNDLDEIPLFEMPPME